MAGKHLPIPQADPKHPKYNPLYDPATDNLPIDQTVQKEIINKPSLLPTSVTDENKQLLLLILSKIESGEIKLMDPSSLINQTVYEKLDEISQGKVDQNAFNLMAVIRQIKGLCESGYQDSYQTQNLVQSLRFTKERLEKDLGNVFII